MGKKEGLDIDEAFKSLKTYLPHALKSNSDGRFYKLYNKVNRQLAGQPVEDVTVVLTIVLLWDVVNFLRKQKSLRKKKSAAKKAA